MVPWQDGWRHRERHFDDRNSMFCIWEFLNSKHQRILNMIEPWLRLFILLSGTRITPLSAWESVFFLHCIGEFPGSVCVMVFLQDNAFTALRPNTVFISYWIFCLKFCSVEFAVVICDFNRLVVSGLLVTRREVLLSDQRRGRGHFKCRYLWSLLPTIFQSLIGCYKQAPSTPATNQVSESLSLIQKLDFLFSLMSLGEAEWMSRRVWACKRETGITTQSQWASSINNPPQYWQNPGSERPGLKYMISGRYKM